MKVAVIGVGHLGQHHARLLAAMEGVELAGVVDIKPGRAQEIADRMLETLRAPFDVNAHEVRIHGSIGIALYSGPDDTAEDLLRHADVAMYAAKTQGKDRWMLFEANVHRATIDRHQLKADLHGALDRDELSLVYQPLVELESMRVEGVEALLRWRHPDRGI